MTDPTFFIRSNLGNGLRISALNPDPAEGVAVEENAVVYLQNVHSDSQWLRLVVDANGNVVNNEMTYSNIYTLPQNENHGAQFILSPTLGTGSPSHGLPCAAIPGGATGKWVPIGYSSSASHSITYQVGVNQADTNAYTTNQNWQNSVTGTISSGFDAFGAKINASLSVSSQYARSQQASVTRAITQSTSVSHSSTFGAGQIWQFLYKAKDICNTLGVPIKTFDIVRTNSSADYPCCLPGLAVDPTQQHGACVPGSPDMCAIKRRALLRGSDESDEAQ